MIGTVASKPDEVLTPAPLEDHDHDAVGGADAQQVHQRGLQGHEHRAEHQREQQERQQDDCADEQRKPVAHSAAQVAPGRRLAADVSLRPGCPLAPAEGPRREAARSVSMVASSCGAVVGKATKVATPVPAHLGGANRCDPRGRPRQPSQRVEEARRPVEDVDGDHERPVDSRAEPVGEQVVCTALGPAVRQRAFVGESDAGARGPARRAPSSSDGASDGVRPCMTRTCRTPPDPRRAVVRVSRTAAGRAGRLTRCPGEAEKCRKQRDEPAPP